MKIKIKTPISFSEIGSRSNNEDAVFPEQGSATSENQLFLVCDGVGGSNKGEVASELACKSIVDYYHQYPAQMTDNKYIEKLVTYAEQEFDAYFKTNPEAKGMGTTLTLLCVHNKGITVAHAGDSRIYHVRHQDTWHTRDHSMLNAMIDQGVITPETAHLYGKKNVIVRAIQGEEVRKTAAETRLITDVQKGDYFFLCTDGILENVTDDTLKTILASTDKTNEQKLAEIKQIGIENHNKDNFSCYLIEVETVTAEKDDLPIVPFEAYQEGGVLIATIVEITPEIAEAENQEGGEENKTAKLTPEIAENQEGGEENKTAKLTPENQLLYILGGVGVLLLLLLIWFFLPGGEGEVATKEEDKKEEPSNPANVVQKPDKTVTPKLKTEDTKIQIISPKNGDTLTQRKITIKLTQKLPKEYTLRIYSKSKSAGILLAIEDPKTETETDNNLKAGDYTLKLLKGKDIMQEVKVTLKKAEEENAIKVNETSINNELYVENMLIEGNSIKLNAEMSETIETGDIEVKYTINKKETRLSKISCQEKTCSFEITTTPQENETLCEIILMHKKRTIATYKLKFPKTNE